MSEQESAGLRSDAARLGVSLDASAAARLLRYVDELAAWNRSYNLTSIDDRAQVLTHHLLDSLAGSHALAGTRVLDIGTGAGLPGLPLALMHPERQFTLIDGTSKKVRFVAHAARVMQLANVAAVHARAEDYPTEEPFDTVIARAVTALPELARLALPLVAPGGCLVAWKGRVKPEELDAPVPGWGAPQVQAVTVPGLGEERCLVTLQRVSG